MVTDTYQLIETVKKIYPVMQFFKDRYFPDFRTFYSEKALIECKKGGRRIAPFVVPVVNGIRVKSEGYRAFELRAPYIAPKMAITPEDLEKKAFGEDPNTNRSPADRENEIEAEHLDELRKSIKRTWEWMCCQIILTGAVQMNHYATAKDAAAGTNPELLEYQFYDEKFNNEYSFKKDFKTMTAKEKLDTFYEIASILRKRHVKATDIVMTSDVSMELMTDKDFLDYYNKLQVRTGEINQVETPAGVTCNGTLNINGILFTLFTYDDDFEDLDGSTKEFLPAGTIAFLQPGLGATVYAQVTFLQGDKYQSYAAPIVPRLYADEGNNVVEVQTFSRPVIYPKDWDGWIVANVNKTSELSMDSDIPVSDGADPLSDSVDLLSDSEINAISKKAELISYANSIGLVGLKDSSSLDELKAAIIEYQTQKFGD